MIKIINPWMKRFARLVGVSECENLAGSVNAVTLYLLFHGNGRNMTRAQVFYCTVF